jgi:geranylgeranylglycerol-phosphate geranylgeranyltransferase
MMALNQSPPEKHEMKVSNSSGSKATFRVSSEGGFVAKRLEPQSGSVRFLHSFPRIGKSDSEETDQPPLPNSEYNKNNINIPPPSKLYEIVKLTRLHKNSIPVSMLCLLSGYITNPYSWEKWIVSPSFIASLIIVQSITAASMVINDIYDIEIDRINQPNRPLVTGTVSVKEARWLVRGLFGLTFYLGLQFIPHVLDPFWIVGMFLVNIYTPFLKKITLVKNVVCAMIISSTVPFIGIATLNLLEKTTASSLANLPLMLLTTQNIFFSSLYIENLLDIRDMKGDNAMGIHTIPVVFGKHFTLFFVACLLVGSNICILLLDPNPYAILSTITIYIPYYTQIYKISCTQNKHDSDLYIQQAIKNTNLSMGFYFLFSILFENMS